MRTSALPTTTGSFTNNGLNSPNGYPPNTQQAQDKPWGPHYFRIGLDLETDFRGGSGFNVKISHNRHWLDLGRTEPENHRGAWAAVHGLAAGSRSSSTSSRWTARSSTARRPTGGKGGSW